MNFAMPSLRLGDWLGMQNMCRDLRALSSSCRTRNTPTVKPWQKLTAAVYIASDCAAEQRSTRSPVLCSMNVSSVTAACAEPADSPIQSAKPASHRLKCIIPLLAIVSALGDLVRQVEAAVAPQGEPMCEAAREYTGR